MTQSIAGTTPRHRTISPLLASVGIWLAAGLVMLLLPQVFSSGASLTKLCLMGIMVIFALAYNMLLGQTGMLSFGHAVYYGLGGFFAAHAMMIISGEKLAVPLAAVPLVGALTGLVFGVIFGAASTRRAGTAFAMISLGIVELVAALALVMTGFFGGEQGVSFNRTKALALFGWKFGPQIQVYYLIAGWCFVSMIAMYFITRTPFGRMCLAVRENPERAAFVGYSTQGIRFIAFCLSGAFAGIAGALAAINFEIASNSMLGAQQSGTVLLMAYIGGAGHFAGPIVGAVLITLLQSSLSDITGAWQLYFGIMFILVVMFVPGGLAGLITLHGPIARAGLLPRLAVPYAKALVPGLLLGGGGALIIELTYKLTVERAKTTVLNLGLLQLDAKTALPWIAAVILLAAGAWTLRRLGPGIAEAVAATRAEALARVGA